MTSLGVFLVGGGTFVLHCCQGGKSTMRFVVMFIVAIFDCEFYELLCVFG